MPSSTMRVLSCANGMPRLLETLTAATNWPRLRKPDDAVIRSVPAGRRPCSLLARLVFFWSFCWTGVNVTAVPVPVPDVVVLADPDAPVVVVVEFFAVGPWFALLEFLADVVLVGAFDVLVFGVVAACPPWLACAVADGEA